MRSGASWMSRRLAGDRCGAGRRRPAESSTSSRRLRHRHHLSPEGSPPAPLPGVPGDPPLNLVGCACKFEPLIESTMDLNEFC